MVPGGRIFYGNYEIANIWGKNLSEHLLEVYGGEARYSEMFISADYVAKIWPSHEGRVDTVYSACSIRQHSRAGSVAFDRVRRGRDVYSRTACILVLQKLGRV